MNVCDTAEAPRRWRGDSPTDASRFSNDVQVTSIGTWDWSVISARHGIALLDLRNAAYGKIAAELRRRADSHTVEHSMAMFGGDSYGSPSPPFHDREKPKRLRALADLLERE